MSPAAENPYVGPRTFTRQEADRFFGREREARQLLSRVISERLVLFYAQSGAGKSSLINARLIPQLEEAAYDVLPVGRVSGDLPEGVGEVDNIYVFNLILSLDQGRSDPNRLGQVSLTQFLTEYSRADSADDRQTTFDSDEAFDDEEFPHVLIVDQFEEIITAHPARWQEREEFFRQLDQAMAADPLLWVVLTFREDFLATLEPYAYLLADKMRARFFMQRLDFKSALAAIQKPAENNGRPFAKGVAETLVDNLRKIRVYGQTEAQPGQFVEPVQLQVVCYQLWENLKEQPPGEITQQHLQELGDVDTALAQFYEQAIAEVVRKTGIYQIELRNWFEEQLITEAGTRGTAYQGQEQTEGLSNEAVHLLENQFIIRAETRAGGRWYELIHDRLVEPILKSNQTWRSNPLIQAAIGWAESGRNEDLLYRGKQLAAAKSTPDLASFGPLVAEFLQASEQAEQARFEAEAQRQRELERAQALAQQQSRVAQRWAGAVLLLPAVICWFVGLVIPTASTLVMSLQNVNPLASESAEFIGLDNYFQVFDDPVMLASLGYTFLLMIVRLPAVAIVPPLLAWAASRFGRPIRLSVRLLLTLPVVLFIPVAIGIIWALATHPVFGLFPLDTPPLANPNTARLTLLLIDGLYTFGLVCGLSIIFYLAIWRSIEMKSPLTFKQARKPLFAIWGVGVLATIALSIPTFTLNYVTTQGGPANSTSTIGLWFFRLAFQFFRFGPAAALASLVLLLLIGLGILAGLLVIWSRLRLSLIIPGQAQDSSDTPQNRRTLPASALVITLLLILGALLLSVVPFVWTIGQSFQDNHYAQLAEQVSIARILLNTIIPPIFAAIIQLGVAYLGALSIGALRPLGKRSDWLLLLFSPWLFVSVLPLSLVYFDFLRTIGLLDSFISLISPILLSIPSLFILTLFFKGQASRWQTDVINEGSSQMAALFKHLIWPSLPLTGMLLVLLLFVGWQETYWPLLATVSPENIPLSVSLLQLRSRFGDPGVLATATTLFTVPLVIFTFVALGIFQLFYLDRLTLHTNTTPYGEEH